MPYLANEHKFIKGVIFRLVKSHIAGSTLSSVLEEARSNNINGMRTTITFLNNGVNDPAKARYNANTYVQIARQTSRLHLNAAVSVRISQLGYKVNNETFEKCMTDLIGVARENGTPVWIEAQSDIGMQELFDVYRTYRKSYQNLGIEVPVWYPIEVGTIRKYFKPKDTVKLTTYAYPDPNLATENEEERSKKKGKTSSKDTPFKLMLNSYITNTAKLLQAGVNVVVLDSDEKTIAKIAGFSKEYKKHLIFELPLGYSKGWLKKLAKTKASLSVYTPYGKDWGNYVINKLTIKHGHIRGFAEKVLAEKDEIDEE